MIKGLKPGRVRAAALAAAVAITMTACNQDPYALRVTDIDESGPQRAAAIQLSDPSIYARETMLNDRRQEVEFLQAKLKESKDEVFEPQMKRIVQFAESFRGNASVSFDPVMRAEMRRKEAVDRLDTDIAIQQRELQKLLLMRQTNDALKNLNQPPLGSETTQLPPINQTSIDELNAKIRQLEEKIKTLEQEKSAQRAQNKSIDLPATDIPRIADIRATPQERFRDLMAYRGELRSALASAEWDDTHDYSGNSLYRLQFTATIPPGQQKNKFGVARVTVVPPMATTFDFADIYRLWLSHVSYRLNGLTYMPTDQRSSHIDTAYATLAAQRDLFRYVTLNLSDGRVETADAEPGSMRAGTSRKIHIVVPPRLFTSASTILDSEDYREVRNLLKDLAGQATKIQTESFADILNYDPKPLLDPADTARYLVVIGRSRKAYAESGRGVRCIETEKAFQARDLYPLANDKDEKTKRYYRAVFELIDPGPSGVELSSALAASLRGMGDWSFLPPEEKRTIEQLHARILVLQNLASDLRRIVGWDNRSAKAADTESRINLKSAPLAATASETTSPPKQTIDTSPSERMIKNVADKLNLQILSDDSDSDCDEELMKKVVPGIFLEFVGQAHYESGRGAFTYASTPMELAQRISTVTSAITSLELGLNVAAQLQGANIGADLSYLRSARGQADAMERLPVVVGFSDRKGSAQTVKFRDQFKSNLPVIRKFQAHQPRGPIFEAIREDEVCFPYSTYLSQRENVKKQLIAERQQVSADAFTDRSIQHCGWTPQLSQFGWIFGPQATLDPVNKSINLEQVTRSYPVVADVSLPSWWNSATFVFESAWISNWHDSNIIKTDDIGFVTRRVFHRPLPHNRADLDGLTEALAYKTIGGSLATTRIMRVEPEIIRYCSDDITLLAYGTNIWRGTEAYLNGVKEKALRVLPDMSGLALTFEASKLQWRKSPGQQNLVIWTRNGPAERAVVIQKFDDCVSKPVAASNPGPAGSGALLRPYLFGTDTSVAMALKPMPQALANASLYVFLQDAEPLRLDSSAREFSADGKSLTLKFSTAISNALPELGTALVNVKPSMAARSELAPTEYAFANPIVYYPTAAAAKAEVTGPANLAMGKPDEAITIKLPELANIAFPATKAITPAMIEASVKDLDKLKPQAADIKLDKGLVTFKLRFTDAGQANEFVKAERKITLKFKGNTLPFLNCDSCLTFKPPAAPTPAEQKKE